MSELRYLTGSLAALVLVVGSSRAFSDENDTADASDAPASAEARVLAIADTILQKHIDPPTRQEMILAGVKALYRVQGQTPPRGLSEQVSRLAEDQEFTDFLMSTRSKLELPEFESVMINGMFRAAPGGGSLVKAADVKVQEQLAANRYVGIGIALTMAESNSPSISRVFYDGPGWKAGIKTNDVILEIDGVSTKSVDLGDVVKMLRGEADTEVTLVVRQPDSEPRMVTITRGVTFIPTIEGSRLVTAGQWQYTIDSAEDIALLRFKSIGPSTLHELRKVEAQLRGKKIRGIVLDLRFGGGVLHDTVMLADQLLDGGTIGHVRSLGAKTTYEARPGCLFPSIPLAVLIAKRSNADRVFLTAALQDQGRAIVIGEPTIGETYVNSFVSVPGGDQIRLATGIMQRADGTILLNPINYRWTPSVVKRVVSEPSEARKKKKPPAIRPDHIVYLREPIDQDGNVVDPQLAKAIEVLRAADGQVNTSTKKDSVSG